MKKDIVRFGVRRVRAKIGVAGGLGLVAAGAAILFTATSWLVGGEEWVRSKRGSASASVLLSSSINPQIRFDQFLDLSGEVFEERQSRLVSVERFLEMAKQKGTMVLDTRSKAAFDEVHIEGAVHLNFSDFTEKKLAEVIPSKETRILIYCNNNFVADQPGTEMAALVSKAPPLALNIPTFINLSGYGYKNVYELADVLPLSETRVPLVGTF